MNWEMVIMSTLTNMLYERENNDIAEVTGMDYKIDEENVKLGYITFIRPDDADEENPTIYMAWFSVDEIKGIFLGKTQVYDKERKEENIK